MSHRSHRSILWFEIKSKSIENWKTDVYFFHLSSSLPLTQLLIRLRAPTDGPWVEFYLLPMELWKWHLGQERLSSSPKFSTHKPSYLDLWYLSLIPEALLEQPGLGGIDVESLNSCLVDCPPQPGLRITELIILGFGSLICQMGTVKPTYFVILLCHPVQMDNRWEKTVTYLEGSYPCGLEPGIWGLKDPTVSIL